MLFLEELTCPQCNCDFITASELLKHFTTHALEEFIIPDVEKDEQKHGLNKKTIPDLRPIIRRVNNECSEENVNPSIFCEVTFEEGKLNNDETPKFEREFSRKYKCLYCKKTFGWSTDLKRHIFTHTGEKPFKCDLCDISYTRRILLHKHITKYHRKSKIPDLKPINSKFTVKVDGNSI